METFKINTVYLPKNLEICKKDGSLAWNLIHTLTFSKNGINPGFWETTNPPTHPFHKSKDKANRNLDSNPNLKEEWVGYFQVHIPLPMRSSDMGLISISVASLSMKMLYSLVK